MAEERHADGGVVQYAYSMFGERSEMRVHSDLFSSVLTRYAYDHLGRLSKVSNYAETWRTLEDGNPGNLQVQFVSADGEVAESYSYDELGRRSVTTDGMNGQRFVRYDHAGNVLAEVDQTGRTTSYAYDAYGHKRAMVTMDDTGPRIQTWEVDMHGRVNAHVDAGGARITYTHTSLGQLKTQKSDARGNIAGQDLEYTYDGEQLVGVEDIANQQETTYAYDLAGNRLREKTVAKGRVVQDNHIKYDQLGRMTHVADGRYNVEIGYDAAGNRETVDTYYIDAAGIATDIHSMNRFDAMNRQTLVDGDVETVSGVDSAKFGARSHELTYDWAGNRTSDKYYATPGVEASLTTETYGYDGAGRLRTTTRDGNLIDLRYYDKAGRQIRSGGDVDLTNEALMDQWKLAKEYRVTEYDAAGRVTRQKMRDLGNNFQDDIYFKPTSVPYPDHAYAGYSQAGNLRGYYVVPPNDAEQTQFKMDYVWFDTAKETLGRAVNSGGTSSTSTEYDGNGFVVKVVENPDEGDSSTRTYVNDLNGQVLLKNDGTYETNSLIVNGQLLGSSSAKTPDASFASTYQAATASGLASAPSAYVVRSSEETPSSIAHAIWGDSKLWYLIADANALSGDEALAVGKTLRIPARVNTVHSDYQTFKPYDAADAVGNTSPTMPAPVVNDKSCGAAGTLVMVVVAVVVTYVTYGYALKLFGPGLAAGVAAGAAGSVASQGVGIAVGAQDKFSWNSVALSAVASGVSYGMAPASGPVPQFAGLEGTSAVAARAAVSNAISQGIGVVTGLQSSFNWRGVVAAGVGAGIGHTLGQELGVGTEAANKMGIGERLLKSTLVGFSAGMTTAAMRGGRINATQIATDAFGNALGSSLAEQMQPTSSGSSGAGSSGSGSQGGPSTYDWPEEDTGARGPNPGNTRDRSRFGDRVIVGSHSTKDSAADEVARQLTLNDMAARSSELEKNIAMLVDVANMQRVDAASQAGLNLRPTVENAINLGLLNGDGSQVQPNPAFDLVGRFASGAVH